MPQLPAARAEAFLRPDPAALRRRIARNAASSRRRWDSRSWLIVGALGVAVPAAHARDRMAFPAHGWTRDIGERSAGLWTLALVMCCSPGYAASRGSSGGVEAARHRLRRSGSWPIGASLAAVGLGGYVLRGTGLPERRTFSSPVRYTAPSIARGARRCTRACVACHGARAMATAPQPPRFAVKPANLTGGHLLEASSTGRSLSGGSRQRHGRHTDARIRRSPARSGALGR